MKRLLLLLTAALAAVPFIRRARVKVYPDWHAWALHNEGEALEPDPYLDGLR